MTARRRGDWIRCRACDGRGVLFWQDRGDGYRVPAIRKCSRCDGSGTTHRKLPEGRPLFMPRLELHGGHG
jgi:DnaJ-class molecular chaperone